MNGLSVIALVVVIFTIVWAFSYNAILNKRLEEEPWDGE
jgi:hypothetical protein